MTTASTITRTMTVETGALEWVEEVRDGTHGLTEHVLLRHRDLPGLDRLDVYLEHGGYAALRKAVTDDDARKRSSTWSRPPVCAGAAAPASRPASSGAFSRRTSSRATSWSTPTSPSRARSKTARSWSATPSSSWRAWRSAPTPPRRDDGLHLLPRRVLGPGRRPGERIDGAAPARPAGEESLRHGLLASRSTSTWAPAPTSAARRRRCSNRSRASSASRACGRRFPAVKGLYAQADGGQQRRDADQCAPDPGARGRVVSSRSAPRRAPGRRSSRSPGTCASPGNYELPLGTTFRELIFDHGGGIPDGKAVKAILPAGASAPMLAATDEVLDTPMDYESVAEGGSMLGSASIIVMDETVDMAWVALKTTRFFKHESCGKCTPCREGTYWMLQVLERLNEGRRRAPDDRSARDRGQADRRASACARWASSPSCRCSRAIEHFRPDFARATKPAQRTMQRRRTGAPLTIDGTCR